MLWKIYLLFFIPLELYGQQLILDIKTPYAIVINADTGAIVYEKNANQRCYPASTTKIATALYILEKFKNELDKEVTVSSSAIHTLPDPGPLLKKKHTPYQLYSSGSSIHLKPGERISIRSLLYGHLLASGNDASNVLAETTSGSIAKFIEELNCFLQSQGIKNTHFTNPHGMPHPDHWTTPADMASIAQMCLKNPTFCEIVRSKEYTCPQTNKNPQRKFIQSNRLLKTGPVFYSKAIGIKTGFHLAAGATLVAAAKQEERTLIAALFQSPDKDQRFKDAIKLFEKAFAEKKTTRVLFAHHTDEFSYPLPGASTPAKGFLQNNCTLSYYPSEEPLFQAQIHWKNTIPIQKNAPIGELKLLAQDGKILHEQLIFSSTKIEKAWNATLYIFLFAALIVGCVFYLLKKK